MILAELRRQTQAHHACLERTVDIFGACRTPETYRRLLETFYGFYVPLEAEAEREGDALEAAGVDWPCRRKAPLLARDLRALGRSGSDIDGLPRCPAAGRFDTLSHALGTLYVVEGATLGGRLVARHLEMLGLTPDSGAAFFHSYGPDVGRRWKSFGHALTAHATTEERQNAAIAAARATFDGLRGWLRERMTP